MSTPLSVHTVETHAEGMPMRVVVAGTPEVRGESMIERKAWLEENLNDIRELLMNEPRGHAAMVGSILMPPTRADADFGVVYMSAGGFWAMCGHGTVGVATAIVNRGMVKITEPYTEVRLDTPAGLIATKVRVQDKRAISVTFTNVPSYVLAHDSIVNTPGFGSIPVSVVYGGNLYAIVNASHFGVKLEPNKIEDLTNLGMAVIKASKEQLSVRYPAGANIGPLRSMIFMEEATADKPAKNLMVKEPRYFDRSPCGTGTSARMALAYHTGELALNEPFVHESIIGTQFVGQLTGVTEVGGITAVIPQITGRAWITGTSEFTLDPSDVFPTGFKFVDPSSC
ncbi:proline racemase family protein [Paraburkholderia aspalathi]|uniref:proline racemase family protein n=1 Tax=Paraburkholderia aspalathi TaxID=1324617 RepID=UPI0038B6DEBC